MADCVLDSDVEFIDEIVVQVGVAKFMNSNMQLSHFVGFSFGRDPRIAQGAGLRVYGNFESG